jgi:hypothetical protein
MIQPAWFGFGSVIVWQLNESLQAIAARFDEPVQTEPRRHLEF